MISVFLPFARRFASAALIFPSGRPDNSLCRINRFPGETLS